MPPAKGNYEGRQNNKSQIRGVKSVMLVGGDIVREIGKKNEQEGDRER